MHIYLALLLLPAPLLPAAVGCCSVLLEGARAVPVPMCEVPLHSAMAVQGGLASHPCARQTAAHSHSNTPCACRRVRAGIVGVCDRWRGCSTEGCVLRGRAAPLLLARRTSCRTGPLPMFDSLPNAIVEHMAELSHPTALSTIAQLEWRCRTATATRLASLARLQAPP